MTSGLSVTKFIQTSVVLAPGAAPANSTGACMIIGDSNVIDVGERFRTYSGLTGVATDFGTSAPEYAAAALHFGQRPQPTTLMIGRWAQTATAGLLKGAILSSAQQALSNFTAVTNGGFKIQVDGAGSSTNVTGINLSAVGNLNAVATAINTALSGASVGATCAWNANLGRFVFTSNSTGGSSKIVPLVAPTSGTDLGALIGAKATSATEVDGIAAETVTAAITAVEAAAPFFHKLSFATTYSMVVADHVAVAAYVEGGGIHTYWPTTSDTSHLAAGSTSNLGYSLMNAGYTRTTYQYSSLSPFAAQSLASRLAVVDYTGQNTAITLAFKQEPGVTAETLNASQSAALDSYRANYLANINNGTQVVVNGWSAAAGTWADVVDCIDAFAFQVQGALYNILYTMPKVPQTDPGVNQLVAGAEQIAQQYVRNGSFAPGVWTGPPIGAINTGDTLADGYYVYAPPVASQSSADRGARKAPTLQIAVKLAGAVQDGPAIINVVQ